MTLADDLRSICSMTEAAEITSDNEEQVVCTEKDSEDRIIMQKSGSTAALFSGESEAYLNHPTKVVTTSEGIQVQNENGKFTERFD